MTTIPAPEVAAPDEAESRPPNWGEIAVHFATRDVVRADFTPGDLADLRRMNPDEPDTAAFWRLMARRGLLDNRYGLEVEQKWGLILHGIALMTPTAGREMPADSNGYRPSAHNPTVPVGQALYQGGEPNRGERPFYSETRLNRLLTARDEMFRALAARAFRMLGRVGQPFNWRQMAILILNEDNDRGEGIRRRIARSYYQSQRRSSQATDE